MSPDSFTLAMQISAVEREIKMRHSVYPGLVLRKKMSQREADIQIAAMEAVLKTLQSLKAQKSDPTEVRQ